jgi:hypothetical protein
MYKKQRLKRSYNHLIITKKREPGSISPDSEAGEQIRYAQRALGPRRPERRKDKPGF